LVRTKFVIGPLARKSEIQNGPALLFEKPRIGLGTEKD